MNMVWFRMLVGVLALWLTVVVSLGCSPAGQSGKESSIRSPSTKVDGSPTPRPPLANAVQDATCLFFGMLPGWLVIALGVQMRNTGRKMPSYYSNHNQFYGAEENRNKFSLEGNPLPLIGFLIVVAGEVLVQYNDSFDGLYNSAPGWWAFLLRAVIGAAIAVVLLGVTYKVLDE
jgi:hypothetical protein